MRAAAGRAAATFSLVAAGPSVKLWQLIVSNNVADNADLADGDALDLHYLIGGYDVGEGVDYWIWSKNLSPEKRIMMGLEVFYGYFSLPKGVHGFKLNTSGCGPLFVPDASKGFAVPFIFGNYKNVKIIRTILNIFDRTNNYSLALN